MEDYGKPPYNISNKIQTELSKQHRDFLTEEHPGLYDEALKVSMIIPGALMPFDISGLLYFPLAFTKHVDGDILEIGTLYGKSCSILSRCAQILGCTMHAIDPQLHILSSSWPHTPFHKPMEFIREYVKYPKLNLIAKPSPTAQLDLPPDSMRFIFVDDGHDHKSVTNDCSTILRLLKVGGVVYFHDYTKEQFPGEVRAIDEWYESSKGQVEEICCTEQQRVFKRVAK